VLIQRDSFSPWANRLKSARSRTEATRASGPVAPAPSAPNRCACNALWHDSSYPFGCSGARNKRTCFNRLNQTEAIVLEGLTW